MKSIIFDSTLVNNLGGSVDFRKWIEERLLSRQETTVEVLTLRVPSNIKLELIRMSNSAGTSCNELVNGVLEEFITQAVRLMREQQAAPAAPRPTPADQEEG